MQIFNPEDNKSPFWNWSPGPGGVRGARPGMRLVDTGSGLKEIQDFPQELPEGVSWSSEKGYRKIPKTLEDLSGPLAQQQYSLSERLSFADRFIKQKKGEDYLTGLGEEQIKEKARIAQKIEPDDENYVWDKVLKKWVHKPRTGVPAADIKLQEAQDRQSQIQRTQEANKELEKLLPAGQSYYDFYKPSHSVVGSSYGRMMG